MILSIGNIYKDTPIETEKISLASINLIIKYLLRYPIN